MKDVIISITGRQYEASGPEDAIELVTDGQYCYKNGSGTLTSRMVFREGKKSTFLYDTPYGSTTMGLDTHKIRSTLGERGGDLEIDYIVDFDHAVVGRNRFKINVRERAGV